MTDPTSTREFSYNIKGQILAETVTLPEVGTYQIDRTYTDLGQPSKVALSSPGLKPESADESADESAVASAKEDENLKLSHEVAYAWNKHTQLATVTSPAGEFAYQYEEHSPSLLTKMTGPAHSVETTYEPHRNLVTGITNLALPSGLKTERRSFNNAEKLLEGTGQ